MDCFFAMPSLPWGSCPFHSFLPLHHLLLVNSLWFFSFIIIFSSFAVSFLSFHLPLYAWFSSVTIIRLVLSTLTDGCCWVTGICYFISILTADQDWSCFCQYQSVISRLSLTWILRGMESKRQEEKQEGSWVDKNIFLLLNWLQFWRGKDFTSHLLSLLRLETVNLYFRLKREWVDLMFTLISKTTSIGKKRNKWDVDEENVKLEKEGEQVSCVGQKRREVEMKEE